jgi:trehalose 6-phosphate synthase
VARLVIVSNRVPPPRARSDLAGGLAVALREAIAHYEGLWFGWSGQITAQPPGEPRTTKVGRVVFATIDLAEADYQGYYQSFSNATLWPLLHGWMELAVFRREDFERYLAVNRAFAHALAPLLRPDDLVWVHDYHLIPLGQALRELGVRSPLGFFLHVPFPAPQVFACLPRGDVLLRAFEAYDVVGLQVQHDADNLNAMLDRLGMTTRAFALPIGIHPEAFAAAALRAEHSQDQIRLRESLAERALVLGVDRLDYSKGLTERFRGFAQLLRRFPEHRNRVTFLQIAPVSRGDVAQYRSLRRELNELAGRINAEHAEFDWTPLRYLTRAFPRTTLAGFCRLARVGLVTPLRDGMNLVAKEYVAAQDPENPGALVLSRFAGAAHELEDAILVNPHDPDEIAEALDLALRMSADERRTRWQGMWRMVQRNTAAAWADRFVAMLKNRNVHSAWDHADES